MSAAEFPTVRAPRHHAVRAIWAVATRDWLTQLRDPKLSLFAAVVAVLLPLSIYVNAREYSTHAARAVELQNRVLGDARTQSGKLTGREIEPALRVVRQPASGFVLVRGIHADLPAYWDVGPAGMRIGPPPGGYLSPAGDASLDIEFIVRVILGLYALLLGIEAVALEREQRTLQALMAQPVSSLIILGGKLAAAAATLALNAAWVGLLSPLAVALITDAPELGRSVIPLMSFVTFCYLLSCYLLGLVLSHVRGGFQRALTIGLSVWICVNVVSLPLAASVSRAVGGQRPRSDFEGELQRTYEATARESERRLGREFLEHAGRSDWWEVENHPETRERVRAALEPVWREYAAHWGNDLIAREAHWEAVSRRQDRIHGWLSVFSPGLAFRRLASDVGGTGPVNAFSWHEGVVDYQAALYTKLFGDRSRLMLRVPKDSSIALMSFQRRSDLTVAELPVHRAPPPHSLQFLWKLPILLGQCAILLVVSIVLFARAGRN